jgi:hypothetical protein
MISGGIVRTDDLIETLSGGLLPAPRRMVTQRLAMGLLAGMAAAFLILVFTLGLRHDLGAAIGRPAFWLKFVYSFSLAGLGLWLVERQSRAGAQAALPGWLLLAPIILMAGAAAIQVSAPQADWRALTMGHTARICSLLIVLLSLPIFAGIFWAMRALAPTRLSLAGATAGLLAGAASATLYGLHCPEVAAPFILVWYSLGILAATALGAMAGRWALRW